MSYYESMADTMKWARLLQKKCPSCGKLLKLVDGNFGELVVCPDANGCAFAIGREKFDEVVEDIKSQQEARSPDKLRDFD